MLTIQFENSQSTVSKLWKFSRQSNRHTYITTEDK